MTEISLLRHKVFPTYLILPVYLSWQWPVSTSLSGWCVSGGTVRWQSCAMLWSSELSWTQILRRVQLDQRCLWGSSLPVRKRTDPHEDPQHVDPNTQWIHIMHKLPDRVGCPLISCPSLQALQMWFPVLFMESEIQSLQPSTLSWVGSTCFTLHHCAFFTTS